MLYSKYNCSIKHLYSILGCKKFWEIQEMYGWIWWKRARERGCDKSEWRGLGAPVGHKMRFSYIRRKYVYRSWGLGGGGGGGGLQRIRPGIYRYFPLLSTLVGLDLPHLPSERSNERRWWLWSSQMNIIHDQYYVYILPASGLRKKRMYKVIKRNTVDVNTQGHQKRCNRCKCTGS